MIVGKVGGRNHLLDEEPKRDGLVRSFVIEHKMNIRNLVVLGDVIKAAQELFRDREGSLPDFRTSDLFEHPVENVRNLHEVVEGRLHGTFRQRAKDFINGCGSFHQPMMPRVLSSSVRVSDGDAILA